MSAPLSVPVRSRAPRHLTERERRTLAAVADSLVPPTAASPAPSSEPDFWDKVDVALDARAEAFALITESLAALAEIPADALLTTLEELAGAAPAAFQALSTVVAGAWLLTAATRDRIGYHGPRPDRAGVEEAADEISDGILDPVLARYDHHSPRWVR
ncbi:hypothetical protein [Cryptosporangium sp. NPDC051539]|uniref:hypothetical protein n=1 Tax=Cryptosporangium sp. NPDC051539 TaxID=3363962 RepID=UPI0037A4FEA9